ncbi:hypothetical protein STCU_10444 [Strigomonas culicis]|uniref:Uncharacterized protein n=1 Tax=Strigomonas culicis TaxID=28005 RepID=S9TMX2_9TRYP|nr:hypothetical protein STCU_10444 [Strigomonas culicis]|eukprot:EPY17728.1 hypothetical protein STCU_10444 [Strigomonas culicis]
MLMSISDGTSYPYRTTSAGLSKAYAVLRQLEFLRQQDIVHPIETARSARASGAVVEAGARRSGSRASPSRDGTARQDDSTSTAGAGGSRPSRARWPAAADESLSSPAPLRPPGTASRESAERRAARPILAPELLPESPPREGRRPPADVPDDTTMHDALQSITHSPTHISIDSSYGRPMHRYEQRPVAAAAMSEIPAHFAELRRSELLESSPGGRAAAHAARGASAPLDRSLEREGSGRAPPPAFFPEVAHTVERVVQGRRRQWSGAETEASSVLRALAPSSFFAAEPPRRKERARAAPPPPEEKECYFDDRLHLREARKAQKAPLETRAEIFAPGHPHPREEDSSSFFDPDDVQETLRHTARTGGRRRPLPPPSPTDASDGDGEAPEERAAADASRQTAAAPPAHTHSREERAAPVRGSVGDPPAPPPSDACGGRARARRPRAPALQSDESVPLDAPDAARGAPPATRASCRCCAR